MVSSGASRKRPGQEAGGRHPFRSAYPLIENLPASRLLSQNENTMSDQRTELTKIADELYDLAAECPWGWLSGRITRIAEHLDALIYRDVRFFA